MRRLLPLLLLAGCTSPIPQPMPPAGAKSMRIEPARHTPLWLCHYDNLLGSDAALYAPVLRFDLSSVPRDAVPRRALLRLRRGFEEIKERSGPRSYPIQMTNVNQGLRIARADVSDDWRRPGEILEAKHETGEDVLWGTVPGLGLAGLELMQATYNRQRYVVWLRTWNPTAPARLGAAAEWDEIDVTSFVQEELRGDRSLTLLVSTETNMNVRWFDESPDLTLGSLANRAEFRPHLAIEYDVAGEPKATKTDEPARRVTGRLALRSTPAPAKVYVEGEFVGTTLETEAVEFPVTSSRVRIRIEKKGFKPWEETVKVSDGGPTQIHAELDRE